jgi:hypothetical protein
VTTTALQDASPAARGRAASALAQLGAFVVLGNLGAVLVPPAREGSATAPMVLAALAAAAVAASLLLSRRPDRVLTGLGDLTGAAGAVYAGTAVMLTVALATDVPAEERPDGAVAVGCLVVAAVAGALWRLRRTPWLLVTAVLGAVLGLLALLESREVLTAGTGAGVLVVTAAWLAAGAMAGLGPRVPMEVLAGVAAVAGAVVLVEHDRRLGLAAGAAVAAGLLLVGSLSARPWLVPLAVLGLAVVLPRVLVPPLGVADGVGGTLVALGGAAGLAALLLAARAPVGGGALALGWLLAAVGAVVLAVSAGTAGLASAGAAFALLLVGAAAGRRRAVTGLSAVALLMIATPLVGRAVGDGGTATALVAVGALVVLVAVVARPRAD